MSINNRNPIKPSTPLLVLAPMAGITDQPFRAVCTAMGADYAVSEMIAADPKFRNSEKTKFRLADGSDEEPKVVQIAGADPDYLADAARFAVDHGAERVDINMGCPAKKVCNQLAGSALLKDEQLVQRLIAATVAAVAVPVTVKMRTGWDRNNINAPTIARLAEANGIAALTIHGRTRACRFNGNAEYETIRAVKASVSIPVIANGDIRSVANAAAVLEYTRCDGVMIGRGAQGNPWLFREIKAFLDGAPQPARPTRSEVLAVVRAHIKKMHDFYGEFAVRLARKHVACYAQWLRDGDTFRAGFNQLNTQIAQMRYLERFIRTTIEDDGVLAA